MRNWKWIAATGIGLLLSGHGGAQAPAAAPPKETIAPNIPDVVAAGTKVQVLKDGLDGTEGPITMPDGSLLFTETTGNRVTRIDKDDKFSTFQENTNGSNALAFDKKGRLYSVQTVKMQVGIIYPKGSEKVLTDNYQGTPYARPNDLTIDKKGGIYFSDAGLNPDQNPPPPPMPLAVYYITPAGKVIRVAEGIVRPNGVLLSRDEKVLYVNDTNGEYLLAFDVQSDGTLKNRRNFAKYDGVTRTPQRITSGADGLAIDSQGRVYVCTQVGIQVFSPKGQALGKIPLSRQPQNMAFAGPNKKTLYIVGRGAAFKIQMQAQGFLGRAK